MDYSPARTRKLKFDAIPTIDVPGVPQAMLLDDTPVIPQQSSTSKEQTMKDNTVANSQQPITSTAEISLHNTVKPQSSTMKQTALGDMRDFFTEGYIYISYGELYCQ